MRPIDRMPWQHGPLRITKKLLQMAGLLPESISIVEIQMAYAAMATISYALLTGDDILVAPKLKAEALLFREEEGAGQVLAALQEATDCKTARAFYLGQIAAVVRHARRNAPDTCQRMLAKWFTDLQGKDGPDAEGLVY